MIIFDTLMYVTFCLSIIWSFLKIADFFLSIRIKWKVLNEMDERLRSPIFSLKIRYAVAQRRYLPENMMEVRLRLSERDRLNNWWGD